MVDDEPSEDDDPSGSDDLPAGEEPPEDLLDAARESPSTVELGAIESGLDADSAESRARAAAAVGLLALAGRDVEAFVDALETFQRDEELLTEPVRLRVKPDRELFFQPRAVAFAMAALVVTDQVDAAAAIRDLIEAYERLYPEFDPDARAYTAIRVVGWALASIVVLTDDHVEAIVELTQRGDESHRHTDARRKRARRNDARRDTDGLRRVGAAALSDVAEEYPPIRGRYPEETPHLVAVLADLLAFDPHPRVRYHAAFALYEFGQGRPDLVRARSDVLRDALDDEYALVRKEAAGTLGLVGASDALSAIRELADDDPEQRVREAAAEAVERLEADRE